MSANNQPAAGVRGSGDARNPYDLLRAQCTHYAGNELFVLPQKVRALWETEKASWTYGEALADVDALAARYRDAGIGPGHRVALLLENRPEHFLNLLALNAVGASAVPINPDATDDELRYFIGHSESAFAVSLGKHAERLRSAIEPIGVSVANSEDAEFPSVGDPAEPATADRAAECAVIYTSGSTGRPKGCLLSSGYFLGWADWYARQGGLMTLRDGTERLMTPLPGFHVNATCHSFMGMLGVGGAQVIIDRFHPRDWWATAVETGATCFHYLGVIPAILLELPRSEQDSAHGLRFGHGGGVHPDHHATFEARFGVPLLEGWTMTETGSATLHCANQDPRKVGTRCIGKSGAHFETRLVDDDGGDVELGEAGELLVRSAGDDPRAGFCSGYLKDAAATEALWAGGWLHTGDVMRRDQDGDLFFVDRKKNIIRRSGENIAAAEVEAILQERPEVDQVAVLAVPDETREEEVLACVAAADGVETGEALARALFDHCNERLAYFKPPGWVMFVDDLPKTGSQKIQKHRIFAPGADPLTTPGMIDLRSLKRRG